MVSSFIRTFFAYQRAQSQRHQAMLQQRQQEKQLVQSITSTMKKKLLVQICYKDCKNKSSAKQ